jgi:hypothetical protein
MMASITVVWPDTANEHGGRTLWFGSWLTGNQGFEGAWFYSGRGGERTNYQIPPDATGLRIRRWPNEGLDAEYADVLVQEAPPSLSADQLDFDAPQPFSLLPEHLRP